MKVIGENEVRIQLKESTGPAGPAGADGKDGTSVTHSWRGTTLTVTSASGTSSADLKGEKGEPGKDGKDGATGLVGPAGADGKDGAPGADGEDGGYYTPAVDNDGNLTWTASKADMPDVPGVNIKGPAGSIDNLPIASAARLGGVMPTAKTDEMTQAVGVDESGGLWTAQNGEKATFESTRLASGTLASGETSGIKPTGLTVADLRKWKWFGFKVQSVSQTLHVGLFLAGERCFYQNIKAQEVLIMWADTEKTRTFVISAGATWVTLGAGFTQRNNTTTYYGSTAQTVNTSTITDGDVKIYLHNDLTADLSWEIWGVIK